MRVKCPHCGTVLEAPNNAASFRCGVCGNTIAMNPNQQYYQPQQNMPAQIFHSVAQGKNEITVYAVQQALGLLGYAVSVDVCHQIMMKYDTNRNGLVGQSEFIQICGELEQWFSVFKALDADHSGRMEFGEFCDGFKKMGYTIPNNVLSLMFSSIDKNHTGCLDANGFIRACSVVQIVLLKYQQLDKSGAGSVQMDFTTLLDIVFSIPL